MVASVPPELRIAIPLDRLADFCRRWRIVRLDVFGSSLREDFEAESDVDFLYTLDPQARWGLQFMDAYDELSDLVGRPVDLVSRAAVERSANWIRRSEILNSARPLYVA